MDSHVVTDLENGPVKILDLASPILHLQFASMKKCSCVRLGKAVSILAWAQGKTVSHNNDDRKWVDNEKG